MGQESYIQKRLEVGAGGGSAELAIPIGQDEEPWGTRLNSIQRKFTELYLGARRWTTPTRPNILAKAKKKRSIPKIAGVSDAGTMRTASLAYDAGLKRRFRNYAASHSFRAGAAADVRHGFPKYVDSQFETSAYWPSRLPPD